MRGSEGHQTMRIETLSRNVSRFDLGIKLLGFATISFGVACFLQRDFTIYWQPVPEHFPLRQPLAFISAGLLVLSGMGLFFSRTRRIAALVQIGLFLAYAASWLSRPVPANLLGIAEQLAIAVGAATIWARLSPAMAQRIFFGTGLTRAAYGCFSIIFALSHVVGLEGTMRAIPAWMPGDPAFWALLTAAGHLATGLALIVNRLAILATRLAGLMYFCFAAIVWTPEAVAHPDQWLRWAGDAITLVLMAAVWLVGDYLSTKSGGEEMARERSALAPHPRIS
jgi:uncharacterized membrane protein